MFVREVQVVGSGLALRLLDLPEVVHVQLSRRESTCRINDFSVFCLNSTGSTSSVIF